MSLMSVMSAWSDSDVCDDWAVYPVLMSELSTMYKMSEILLISVMSRLSTALAIWAICNVDCVYDVYDVRNILGYLSMTVISWDVYILCMSGLCFILMKSVLSTEIFTILL